MATVAPDNVVQFPENTRGLIGGRDSKRTLKEARELVAQKLREAIRTLFGQLQEDLAAKGDVAVERDQRNFYYGSRELLRESLVRVEGVVAAHWLRLSEMSASAAGGKSGLTAATSLDELELVDLGDMDEQIAVKTFAGRLHDACEEGLFAASRRLAHLSGLDELRVPIESMVSDALDSAAKECALPGPLRIEILDGAGRRVADLLGPVIHDLNAFLVGRRVLPTLRRTYSKAPADKARAADSSAATVDAGDVFAALQKLVGVTSTLAQGSGAPSLGGGVPGGGGMPGGGGSGGTMSQLDMAAAMQHVMTSLDSLQHSVPVAVGIPTSSILREFRESSVGQGLDHLDAVTVDIVATLFDFIFDDPAVGDPIKAVVGRLQIPVLKVAMLDKTFFSSKSHPARRLLDSISRAASRCGPQAGHDDPLYAHISTLVERLQSEFKQDAGLFDVLCGELNEFLEQQEHDADDRAAKAAPLVVERERKELAAVTADAVLVSWLSSPLPAAVSDMLTHEWRALLARRYIEDDQEGWELAIQTAGDLVASVEATSDAASRKELAAKLPTLVKRIHDGLDQLNVAMDRRVALLDSLFTLHAAVLRGAAPVVTEAVQAQAQPLFEPELVSESVELEDHAIFESLSLVGADNLPVPEDDSDNQHRVDELQRGDWVEFPGESGPVRYRLSWVSPERGIMLFTNPHSPKALSVAPAALARQLERGEASIIPVEPIFERAVTRALETLKAA